MVNYRNIKDIRRENVSRLIAQCKNTSEFAAIIGKDSSQVRQWFPRANGDAAKKGIGDKIAKQIEEAFHKPDGWLDVDQSEVAQEGREEFIAKVIAYIEENQPSLSASEKGQLINDMLTEHDRNPMINNGILDRAINIWLSLSKRIRSD